MLFARSYRFSSRKSVDSIKSALIGKHFKVHNLDFEIYEKDRFIKIIPHAEDQKDLMTLPITHVELKGKGDSTDVHVSYKLRKIDQGGPYLIVTFCFFLLVGAMAFYFFNEHNLTLVMLGISVIIFGIFWLKMRSGYFDYVSKIKHYMKQSISA